MKYEDLVGHCLSSDCRRGSSAGDRCTAIIAPETFNHPERCECSCTGCRIGNPPIEHRFVALTKALENVLEAFDNADGNSPGPLAGVTEADLMHVEEARELMAPKKPKVTP